MIDVAMTATIRPQILERTLKSLRMNLRYSEPFCFWINLDPVGEEGKDYNDIVEVMEAYTDHYVINESITANHLNALKWTWAHCSSPFILQWEDDWELQKPVDLAVIIQVMTQRPRISQVYFDRVGKSILTYPRYRGRFSKIQEKGFWVRTQGKSVGGPPALLRKEYVQQMLPYLCKELDLLSKAHTPVQQIINDWDSWMYIGQSGSLVQDIGRDWCKENGLVRNKKNSGLVWVNK